MRFSQLKQTVSAVSMLAIATLACGIPGTAASPGYTLDTRHQMITIHNTGDVTQQINSAMAYLMTRPDKNTPWTVQFDGGRYILKGHIYADNLQNVSLISDRSNPAVLIKGPGYANEYMIYSRFSKNVSVSGFQFYGKSKVFNPKNYEDPKNAVWTDQGLYFASSNGITIEKNRFHDFGNAAVRVTTSESDPVAGVNSFNTKVTNNYFKNIFQVTTTSNSYTRGATANYLFSNNNVVDLHGAVKFASRTPGATHVRVVGNAIMGSTSDGFEISSYVNLDLSYNKIMNIARHAINCYTNLRATPGFQWGDNITIKGNIIDNADVGIRFSPEPYSDGFKPVPRNVAIVGNKLSNLRSTVPAINVVNGDVHGLTITRNKLYDIASYKPINVSPGSQNVTISDNTVDNQDYIASH